VAGVLSGGRRRRLKSPDRRPRGDGIVSEAGMLSGEWLRRLEGQAVVLGAMALFLRQRYRLEGGVMVSSPRLSSRGPDRRLQGGGVVLKAEVPS
jgi:hypothetical protein